jgi:hypothetical protein
MKEEERKTHFDDLAFCNDSVFEQIDGKIDERE